MPSTNDPADVPESNESDESNYATTFDPGAGESASEAVIAAIAALRGSRPAELSALYDVVDPDALDGLVDHAQRTDAESHELWFTYEGCDVGVRSDGQVRIREADGSTAPDPN